VEERGFRALSAREIAREIGYAPGTLYNMYDNLDEILLRVESRVLKDLDDHIVKALSGKKQQEQLGTFVEAYIDFAYENPRLWELVQFHYPELKQSVPEWYLDFVYAPMQRLEAIVGVPLDGNDADEAARAARQLWSVIHGIIQMATTPKFGMVAKATTIAMVDRAIVEWLRTASQIKPILRVENKSSSFAKRERRAS
jgi:AcrR family transcriptional regulator